MTENTAVLPTYKNRSDSQTQSLDGLVLGSAGLAGIWGPVDQAESVDTLLLALQEGVTALDTAPAYSNAEELVGLALRQWRGKMPAVSTKVGKLRSDRPDENVYDFSPEAIRRSVYNSLELLNIDTISVLFLHDPTGVNRSEIDSVLTTLDQLRREGVVQALGIGGNFPASFQEFIREGIFQVFMGYNRMNAVCREALSDEFPFLKARHIKIWQASPLYMGLLGRQFDFFLREAPEWIPEQYIRRAEKLRAYAAEEPLSLAETALRYLRSTAEIDKLVIGASSRTELQHSLRSWRKGSLPPALFDKINELNAPAHAAD